MGLFLSSILGGPEQLDKPFDKLMSLICNNMESHKHRFISPEDGTINVVFQFAGTILKPSFAGVRSGSFSRLKKILVMQVSLPPELQFSDSFVRDYLILLKDALAEGKKYFDDRSIAFSLEDHIALAEKSAEGLMEAI